MVEVGAYAGDLTRAAARVGRRRRRAGRAPSTRRRSRSSSQLGERAPRARADPRDEPRRAADASRCPTRSIIDGDHNYYTVSEELRMIAERAPGADAAAAALPRRLLAARAPRRLLRRRSGSRRSTASRSPTAAASSPASRACARGGLPYRWSARPRGRPAQRRADRGRGLRRRRTTGCAWRSSRRSSASAWSGTPDAPWADALARHPRARGTATRCSSGWRPTASLHLAAGHGQPVERDGPRAAQRAQEALLRRLLESSAFALAERLSRAAPRGAGDRDASSPRSSREDDVRRALAATELSAAGGPARREPRASPSRSGAVSRQPVLVRRLRQLALELLDCASALQLRSSTRRASARPRASASARRARAFQSPRLRADVGHAAVPLLGDAMWASIQSRGR